MKTKKRHGQKRRTPAPSDIVRIQPVVGAIIQAELLGTGDWSREKIERVLQKQSVSRASVAWALGVSGFLGLLLGLGCGWQIAVESAQVVAGTVSYPIDNPFYMYHVKTWTLLHQIPALLLWLGASEQVASLLISGLIGMASFQAITLCAMAIGPCRFYCLLPIVFWTSNACTDASALYPVQMLPHDPWLTYGVLGAALAVGSWSLLGVGFVRTGALVMGLAPAFHPALGAWAIACGVAGQFWNRRAVDAQNGRFARWLTAGIALSLLSLAVHRAMLPPIDAPDRAEATRLVASFTDAWDSHRGAYPLDFPAPMMALAILAMSWLALVVSPLELSPNGQKLVRILVVSSAGGLALAVLTLWQDRLPTWLVAAMPGRYINLVGLVFPALLFGLLFAFSSFRSIFAICCLLTIALGLRSVSLATSWFYVPPTYKMMLVAACWMFAETVRPSVFVWIKSLERTRNRGTSAKILFAMYAPPLATFALAARWFSTDTVVAWLTVGVGLKLLYDHQRLRDVKRLVDEESIIVRFGSSLWASMAAVLAACGCMVGAIGWGSAVAACGLGWLLRKVWLADIHKSLPNLAIEAKSADAASPHGRRLRLVLPGIAIAIVMASIGVAANAGYQKLGDWRSQTVYSAANRHEGLLLTCARMRLIQLRTRRPLVISCFGINQITYVPESAPGINRALIDIYGEDLAAPRPEDWRRCGGLPAGTGQELWESRSREDWQELARKFGFTQVIAFSDWQLDLPLVEADSELRLYSIAGE